MVALAQRLAAGFAASFGGAPAFAARAPGRINLIGEHTDYNDGFALPMAISRETQVAFRAANGRALTVAALDFAEYDRIDLDAITHLPGGGWRNYVRGVLVELARAGFAPVGGELAIAGNIAKGTGLSSSASLEVAVATAMLHAAGRSLAAVPLALLAQRAECDFVGLRCGNLDQIAAAATRRGHALLIDCRTLALEQVAIPADVAIMVVQSGVVRGLLDGEYNSRRQECERAAAVLGVAALRDADAAMLNAAKARIGTLEYRRARHVIGENRRTCEAAQALGVGDLAHVGRLLRESQRSQAEDFAITVPDTERLAELMNAAIGPDGGARQTGGGFGGAVIGLMPADRFEAVRSAVLDQYRTAAGAVPDIHREHPGDGTSLIEPAPPH